MNSRNLIAQTLKATRTASSMYAILALILALNVSALQAQTVARVYTTQGDFDIELREDLVPITANNFIDLVNLEFYDGILWHRIIAGFVIQTGDPTGTGCCGPGYTIPDEFALPTLNHGAKGVISMANAGPNTGGSQWFVTLSPQPHLDSLHSVFGHVVGSMAAVDALAAVPTNGNGVPVFAPRNDSIRIISTPTNLAPKTNRTAILGGNFPNPFAEGTTIAYGLYEGSEATLRIFDVEGRLVREMLLGFQAAGDHKVQWDARDAEGRAVAPGTYFYQLQTPTFVDSRPMVLVR